MFYELSRSTPRPYTTGNYRVTQQNGCYDGSSVRTASGTFGPRETTALICDSILRTTVAFRVANQPPNPMHIELKMVSGY